MHTVIIGGSAAGLVTALLLARDGHTVDVLDTDDLDPAADPETAAKTALRPSAPQLVHSHTYHPPALCILAERLPEVYRALLDAGAVPSPATDRLPPTVVDRSARSGDDRLGTLLARRSTMDWVLRAAAATRPGLRRMARTRVRGLLTSAGDPPRVLGVRTERGEHRADIVIDASGRRSTAARWLSDAGARAPRTEFAECGIAYYTRHYRVRPGARLPDPGRISTVAFLRFLTAVALSADNGTLTITLCPLAEDRPMRALRHPEVHAAVAGLLPRVGAWLRVADPVSEVFAMGGLHNTLRRLVVDGRPVALGLHTVGDACATTNPTFGRGLSLALRGAVDIAEALAEHPDDPWAQARTVDAAVAGGIAPWYAEQAAADAARLVAVRAALRGEQPVPLPDPAHGVTPAHLRAAATVDPDLYRSLASVVTMLRRPSEVYDDPRVQARVRTLFAAGAVPPLPTGPSRAELLAAVDAAG